MPLIFFVLLLAFLQVVNATAQEQISMEVDGITRTALVASPAPSRKPYPLVFFFHGHGGTARHAARTYAVHQEWPEAVVVYPQGLPTPGKTDPEGKRSGWQQGPDEQQGRDVKFFDALLTKIRATHSIDNRRIYSMGHSNGAVFTYVLAAARPDTFAALAPCAGIMRPLTGRPQPVPVIHFAGTNDPIVPFAAQKLTLNIMRRINQCQDTPQPWHDDTPSCQLYHSPTGHPVIVMTHELKHAYPPNAAALSVRFFKENQRPEKP